MAKEHKVINFKDIPFDPEADVENRESLKELVDYAEKSFQSGFDILDTATNTTATGWDAEVPALIDAPTLKSLFFSEDWVFIIVDLIANKISSTPLLVAQETMNPDGTVTTDFDFDHPLNALLERPNPWQDGTAFLYNYAVELALMGNAIAWFAKSQGHFVIIPADRISLRFDSKGMLESYMVEGSGGDSRSGFAKHGPQMMFDVKDIAHTRRPNPNSLFWGLSAFNPGRKATLFNRYTEDYLNSFYLKQATPALALKIDKEANEKIAIRQLRSFEAAYTGRRNQRRTMILPKGVDVETLSHSLADQKIIEMVNMNRETILNLFKVPKHEVGLAQAGSLGSEEHRIALRNFWESTLIPFMDMIAGTLTQFFGKQLNDGQFFKFDTSNVVALQENKDSKAETAKKLLESGWSLNEVRTQVWQLQPDAAPASNAPFPLLTNIPAPTVGSAARLPDRPVENETTEEAQELEDVMEDNETLFLSKELKTKINEIGNIHVKQFEREIDNKEESMFSLTLGVFLNFAEAAIIVLRNTLKESPVKPPSPKSKAEIPSKTQLRRRIERALEQFEEQYTDGYQTILQSSVELGYDTQLDFVFNQTDQNEIATLRARDEQMRRLTLESRGIESFSQISKTHTERIMREITKGVEEGQTVQEIANRVAQTFADPEAVRSRATTIARTETLSAVSVGQSAALQNAKEVIPGLKKTWITAGDERVRPSHVRVDGQIRNPDAKFVNGLKFPRDPSGPAAEIINCFPEDQIADAIDLELAYRRFYIGPMVSVDFDGGQTLTGTPNHPILTNRGWVPMASLKPYDYMIQADGFINSASNRNIAAIESEIGEVFNAFSKSLMSVRKRAGVVNFHGDATDENVDIVNVNRSLKNRRESYIRENISDGNFHRSSLTQSSRFSSCGQDKSVCGIRSPHRGISSRDLQKPSVIVHRRPFNDFGLRLISPSQSQGSKIPVNSGSGDVKSFRDLIDRNLVDNVKFVKVRKINISSFSGHVYNLQTKSGIYLTNKIVNHNCRCTLAMLPPEADIQGLPTGG